MNLKQIGRIAPLSSAEIKSSRIGLGFEKLDRAVFDPEKAYDKVAALGVKKIRIQSGWARTEKERGVYDFGWLDDIVDNLLSRGLEPWLCLCYGNGLYDVDAAKIFGAVGCPPRTDEVMSAWLAYVKATVSRYRGKISLYEVWNEPDGIWCWKHGVNAAEYGRFAAVTAAAIKETDNKARVAGGVVCLRPLDYLFEAMEAGMGDVIDAVTFHEYTADETQVYERVKVIKSLCASYGKDIAVIQGESGSQSRQGGNGALREGAWTPERQAKQLLRHTAADLISGVEFASYFSCMDMIEALNGKVGDKASYLDYGYFGVIGADFDENGVATGEYSPKPSYYALQNLCALLGDSESCKMPYMFLPSYNDSLYAHDVKYTEASSGAFIRRNTKMLLYWKPTPLMTTDFEGSATIQTIAEGKPSLLDLMDGKIYEIPPEMIKGEGQCRTFRHLPIKDYPMALVFEKD